MTPTITDIHLEKLLDKMKLQKSSGIYVEVKPDTSAELYECIYNVKNKIKINGGKEILGWEIWKTDILIEAQFHSVWQSPNGNFEDITPRESGAKVEKILFFPDKKLKYAGYQKDNIRLNITDNRLVDDFIQLVETLFIIQNKGAEKYNNKRVLEGKEAEYYSVGERIKIGIYTMINQGLNRNSPCFCGSETKYKHCHGKKFSKTLEKICK